MYEMIENRMCHKCDGSRFEQRPNKAQNIPAINCSHCGGTGEEPRAMSGCFWSLVIGLSAWAVIALVAAMLWPN